MRVLICGSRTFDNAAAILDAVMRLELKYLDGDLVCIHGDARGADKIAATICERRDWTVRAYPADWSLGRRAGYVRNQQMLDEGKPDLVLAFRSAGESRGTDMMVKLARDAGVPTFVYSE